jgi:hypothetical protein
VTLLHGSYPTHRPQAATQIPQIAYSSTPHSSLRRYSPTMAGRERDIRERPVHAIAERAAKANELVDEARAAGGGDHPVASPASPKTEVRSGKPGECGDVACNDIIPRTTVDRVVSKFVEPAQEVVAAFSIDLVVTMIRDEIICTLTAANGVVPRGIVQDVACVVADQCVIE